MHGSFATRPRRFCFHALVVVLAAAGLLSWNAQSAFATHVRCGDTVTSDTRLDSDLVNCSGPGLVIGADDITIDLNGHTIAGDLPGLSEAGVDDSLQYDRIVIENGTITGFYDGVLLKRASGSVLRQLTISNVIEGLHLLDSSDNTVEKNSVSRVPSGNGILLEGDSDRNRVEKNTVSGANAAIGIEATGPSATMIPEGNLVEKNELRANDFGVFLAGLRNRLEKNELRGNGIGVFLLGAGQNVIENNWVLAGDAGMWLMESDDNRLSSNRVDGHFLGILVQQGSAGTIVENNTASHNADDGIHVDDPSTTLTGNVANENGDLGIEAVAGVTDGGGNRARGNGNSAQCVNVACR
jgi:parallel beta-helix repeat protein